MHVKQWNPLLLITFFIHSVQHLLSHVEQINPQFDLSHNHPSHDLHLLQTVLFGALSHDLHSFIGIYIIIVN